MNADISVAMDSSDDELDWEEVQVPDQRQEQPAISVELELSSPALRQNIEITLQAPQTKDDTRKKAAAAIRAQRVLRTTSHKIHTVALLANARVRNKWINDPLLHARLLSITPLALQNGFAMIHKSRVPDQNKRGRLFEAAVERLVVWWCESFFTVTPTGHIRSKTFEEVEEEIGQSKNPDGSAADNSGYEHIRSAESLMKHVLMRRGCRDTSAQLFTALCRALDIPARLIVSLQSVPWKSKVRKPAPKSKGKPPQTPADGYEHLDSDSQGEVEGTAELPSRYKGKGKEAANPLINLRGQKSQSNSRSGSASIGAKLLKPPDPTATPPVFWTEVFSRADVRWFPVDPIRGIVNKRHVFDPSLAGTRKTPVREDNRMLYVIGLEEDGFGRDITARYAHEYTAKISKAQAVGAVPANGRREWWATVVQSITRPYHLQRDDVEDDELHTHQLTEGMPTTIAGFKNHPLYALSRHLRRDQVIDPPTELGKFRGEPVYPRSSVISLKSAENWMRQGRTISKGCQPMKIVKQRAATVNRQREMEFALEKAEGEVHADGREGMMQGLYAISQTELYKPEPIIDGKIPKNDFGNIDLYVPSMLPQGAVHIPFKVASKIAKKLGFDYAEAVTGFEFRKRRAIPVIEGIVAAAENEDVIVEACLEAEQEAEERARAKQLERACKRWTRLVHGLRIRERLQKQYASGEAEDPGTLLEQAPQKPVQRRESWLDTDEKKQPGGHLTTADDVVEPFHLPRNIHKYDPVTTSLVGDGDRLSSGRNMDTATGSVSEDQFQVPTVDGDADGGMEVDMDVASEVDVQPPPRRGMPKTMRELAESHARPPQGGGEATPPSRGEKEDQGFDMSDREVLEGGTSRRGRSKAPGRRAAKGRQGPKTRSTMMSKKRARRPSDSEDATHVDEEGNEDGQSTPSKRRQLEASGSTSRAPSSNPVSGRVLRPRPQKSAARVREERAM